MSGETQAEAFIKILSEILDSERRHQKKKLQLELREGGRLFADARGIDFQESDRSLK